MSERFLNKAVAALVGNDAHYDANETEITNWRSPEGKQPTKEALDAKMKEIEAEYDAQAYARTRERLYPKIGDQLDDLYKQGAFSSAMAAKIKKVKDDNPKG
tara:strand:- start:1986 stop:2291 length:306 start_codon:yes stop_codon:yes gene_type:complete